MINLLLISVEIFEGNVRVVVPLVLLVECEKSLSAFRIELRRAKFRPDLLHVEAGSLAVVGGPWHSARS